MFSFNVLVLTLVFATFIDSGLLSPHRSRSNGDQYREGAEGGVVPRVKIARFHATDATDQGAFSAKNKQKYSIDAEKPRSKFVARTEKDSNEYRNKRSFYPYPSYSYQIPQFQSIDIWKPSFYPLQRPYFVPIYGFDGRIPLYFPPQPIYINPGTPPNNPLKPPFIGPTYLPPTYLPPVTQPPPNNETTTMPTDNRFGDNDYDDRPIWDNGNDQGIPVRTTTMRPSNQPTRKPVQPNRTFPPLVHKDGESGARPATAVQENTTQLPAVQPPGPGRCVWAIVSCCSTSSREVNYRCFDQLGCSGPFWDASPCESDYAKAAIESALNYYNSRS